MNYRNKKRSHLPLILPYFLIKFQKPTIINPLEPRLPSVGLCIQYVYQISSFLELKNWIDYHLYMGIGEIRFYDALANKSLTKFIQENYENNQKLTVISYDKHSIYNNFFDLFDYLSLDEKFKKYLLDYYDYRINRIPTTQADDLTTNDCFSAMRYKHEFIAHYDLDEIIFPRSFDNIKDFYGKKTNYNCKDSNEICSINPFTFKNSQNQNYFYDYLNSLIESERNGRDREKLRSIDFRRTLIFKPDEEIESRLLKKIGEIIEKINSKSLISFPLKLHLNLNSKDKTGYEFLIETDDVDYIKYLYSSYYNLIPCSLNKYLNSSIYQEKIIDNNLVRFLYFVTEYEMRHKNYKKIHYYKNVYSIFTHWATDFEEDSWTFIPSPTDGHLIHHFRKTWKNINYISTDSIRLLNIDYEYLLFLLKDYSKFCSI